MAKTSTENNQSSIGEIVRKAERDYIGGVTTISKYVEFSLEENTNKIDAYINSKPVSGDVDSMGREKPFFNIVTGAVNIWYRATDIDRKNIKIRATKSSDILVAFLANIHLQDWMRKENYGAFLNEWGRSLARNGSSVLKFVEKEGKLYSMVIPWNRLIVDSVDIDNGPKIEVLELTEAQLRQRKGYDKDMVNKLCDAKSARQTLGKRNKDNKNDFIKLYEVHGQLPLSFLTGEEKDEDTYVQQMHVISFVASKEKGEFDDYTLISGKEEKDPYMITHLIKEDGRSQSIGAVEHLFEAQWMMNHTVKSIKDQLDLASKLIFQTSDGSFVSQNALTAIESGDILVHKVNEPITQVNNNSHDVTSLQSFGNQWKVIAQEIAGTPDSLMGNTAPSGTAWRQVEALQQEAHSLFELMTENKGIHIEEMLRNYIIPFLKKKMDHSKEIGATLEEYQITKIDRLFVPAEATKRLNRKIIDALVKGELPQGIDPQSAQNNVQAELAQLGNSRFFKPSDIKDKTWNEIFKDLEWDIEVDVTGEASFSKDDLATLTTVMQTIAANPAVLNDPNAKLIFNKILSITGTISPLELASQPPQPSPVQPSDIAPTQAVPTGT